MIEPGLCNDLFRDQEAFRRAFVSGLERMLERHRDLGVFILVLANATNDALIHARLQGPLRQRFDQLSAELRATLIEGRTVPGAADDLLVFLKLMAVGFDQLELTRLRKAGMFELQFNPLRAYRPPRMSDVAVDALFRPFNRDGFHFNKPFLEKEIFWSGELAGHDCRLLYNKFPFAELHGLLVIGPEENKPQWMTQADHLATWQICSRLGERLAGVGFGYNAYGAYASVNHLHLQMFVRSTGAYPVESRHWRHLGGDVDYPVECRLLECPDAAWQAIHDLHQANIPYNLLYRPGRLYLMPRRFQGDYRHADWTGGYAWSELCGAVTTFNAGDYQHLDQQALQAEMAKLRT